MTPQALLLELNRRGVTLVPEGDRIRYSGPKGAITAEIKAELTRLKSEILDALRPYQVVHDAVAAIEDKALSLGWDQERLWGTGSKRPDLMGLAEILDPDETVTEVTARFIAVDRRGVTTRLYNPKAAQPWITPAGSSTEHDAGNGADQVGKDAAPALAAVQGGHPAGQPDAAGAPAQGCPAVPPPPAQGVRSELPADVPTLRRDKGPALLNLDESPVDIDWLAAALATAKTRTSGCHLCGWILESLYDGALHPTGRSDGAGGDQFPVRSQLIHLRLEHGPQPGTSPEEQS